jgi:hypothetical protein
VWLYLHKPVAAVAEEAKSMDRMTRMGGQELCCNDAGNS